MSYTSHEFLERVHLALDPDEVVDILGLSTKQLVYLLADTILEEKHKFEEYVIEFTDEEEDTHDEI